MINNRQTGRRRGRGGGGGGGGNGPRQGGGQGNGSRIDNRARGNATQLHEKYKNLAADAQRAGDRVNTEYYLQFADHYFRVLSEQRGRFEDQQQPRRPQNDFDYEGDGEFGSGDFGDEGEPIRAGEQAEAPRGGDRSEGRDDRPREFRNDRDGNRRDREPGGREQGGREQTGRDQVAREQGNREQPRREWRDRDDRGERRNGDGRTEARPAEVAPVAGQHRADPIGPGEVLEHRAEAVLEADRPLDPPPARRRGRPPRDAGLEAEPVAFEADRLPPALGPALGVAANDEGEAAPRRRRVRRPADETPTAAE